MLSRPRACEKIGFSCALRVRKTLPGKAARCEVGQAYKIFRVEPRAKRRTSNPFAWHGQYHETYRIYVKLPAMRLHVAGGPQWGRWFAVERYQDTVRSYKRALALGSPASEAELFILLPGARTTTR